MSRPPFLILHKSEWNRLQRQGGLRCEEPVNIKREYLKALTDQSQEWMKTWPESLAGRLAKIEKEKKKQQKANIEFINTYKNAGGKTKKENVVKAIKEAKQLIFEGSNFGRKLLSALLESRAIDERDAQIRFNEKVQKRDAELEKDEVSTKEGIDSLDKNAERENQEKLKTLECIRANQEMVLIKKEKESEEKLIEKQCAIEENKLMEQVIEIEKKKKEDFKRCLKPKPVEYKADTKKITIIKEHEQKLTNALIEAHKNEQDRIKLKTRAVLKKVHQGRPDTKWSKDLYEKIKQIQTEKNKRYEDFVDKGVKAYEQRNSKKETTDSLQEKQNSSNKYLISQRNKIAGEELILAKKCENKCACDRQSLIMKVTAKPVKKTEQISTDESSTTNKNKKTEKICDISHHCVTEAEKLSFLAPCNNLTEELRKREKEPSPWNAAQGIHAQFAQQAGGILKEINHKYFAKKVVDEYRELNCLDATTLPVPNY